MSGNILRFPFTDSLHNVLVFIVLIIIWRTSIKSQSLRVSAQQCEWGPKSAIAIEKKLIIYKNLSKLKTDFFNHNWFTHKIFVLFGKYDGLYHSKL